MMDYRAWLTVVWASSISASLVIGWLAKRRPLVFHVIYILIISFAMFCCLSFVARTTMDDLVSVATPPTYCICIVVLHNIVFSSHCVVSMPVEAWRHRLAVQLLLVAALSNFYIYLFAPQANRDRNLFSAAVMCGITAGAAAIIAFLRLNNAPTAGESESLK